MSFCAQCGGKIPQGAGFCPACGHQVVASVRAAASVPQAEAASLGDNPGMRLVLPIGCSGWTIAAGYCGLCSFIPFLGLLLAILSIVFGILGFVSVSRNPHKHGIARVIIGWIFFAIPSIVLHLIAFFA